MRRLLETMESALIPQLMRVTKTRLDDAVIHHERYLSFMLTHYVQKGGRLRWIRRVTGFVHVGNRADLVHGMPCSVQMLFV